jgi:hypothetical protein
MRLEVVPNKCLEIKRIDCNVFDVNVKQVWVWSVSIEMENSVVPVVVGLMRYVFIRVNLIRRILSEGAEFPNLKWKNSFSLVSAAAQRNLKKKLRLRLCPLCLKFCNRSFFIVKRNVVVIVVSSILSIFLTNNSDEPIWQVFRINALTSAILTEHLPRERLTLFYISIAPHA